MAVGLCMFAASFTALAARYVDLLRAGAAAGVFLSAGVWISLFLTAGGKSTKESREYISVPDAGDWLYTTGSQRFRNWLRTDVPDQFATIRDSGAAFIHAASQRGVCRLYGKRGDSLPLELLSSDDIEMNNLASLYQTETEALGSTYVRRRDLKKIRADYEAAVADIGDPPKN